MKHLKSCWCKLAGLFLIYSLDGAWAGQMPWTPAVFKTAAWAETNLKNPGFFHLAFGAFWKSVFLRSYNLSIWHLFIIIV